jgi:hypothetical protein
VRPDRVRAYDAAGKAERRGNEAARAVLAWAGGEITREQLDAAIAGIRAQ